MQIRFIEHVSGACDGVELPEVGGIVDLENDSARWFIERGIAEEVVVEAPEAAAPEPVEPAPVEEVAAPAAAPVVDNLPPPTAFEASVTPPAAGGTLPGNESFVV